MRQIQKLPYYIFLVGLLLALPSCLEKFDPKVKDNATPLLVVDGFINSKGITTIKLSRTVNISENNTVPAERNALVRIEEEGGRQIALTETQPGSYTSPATTLNTTKKYRLYLKTADGQAYESEYAEVKNTPPIDNLYWQMSNDGVSIYVDAHDAQKATQYYRWDYEETWEFTSAFLSGLEYKNPRFVQRTENVYNCWKTVRATAVNTFSTASLTDDIVRKHSITEMPTTSSRLRYKYSILVKQYAQSKAEFDYWNLLKKNTEDIGSLFGTLPVQLTGNIHAVDNANAVALGYVGVGSEETKRIFISRAELPAEWRTAGELDAKCTRFDTIKLAEISVFLNPGYLPIEAIYKGSGLIGYSGAQDICVDCRKTGTNVKPSFWQ